MVRRWPVGVRRLREAAKHRLSTAVAAPSALVLLQERAANLWRAEVLHQELLWRRAGGQELPPARSCRFSVAAAARSCCSPMVLGRLGAAGVALATRFVSAPDHLNDFDSHRVYIGMSAAYTSSSTVLPLAVAFTCPSRGSPGRVVKAVWQLADERLRLAQGIRRNVGCTQQLVHCAATHCGLHLPILGITRQSRQSCLTSRREAGKTRSCSGEAPAARSCSGIAPALGRHGAPRATRYNPYSYQHPPPHSAFPLPCREGGGKREEGRRKE